MSELQLRWSMGVHVGLFTVGIVVGLFTVLLLGMSLETLWGLTLRGENAFAVEYGVEGLVIGHLLTGALSFALGAAICKRVLPEPTRWSSAVAGGIYGAIYYLWLFFVPISAGHLSGQLFVGFWFLAPAVTVALLPFISKRSNSGVQPTPGGGRG